MERLMRQCEIRAKASPQELRGHPQQPYVWRKATFHQWGVTDKHGGEEVSIPLTIGIVELENGRVMKMDPADIRFTGEPE